MKFMLLFVVIASVVCSLKEEEEKRRRLIEPASATLIAGIIGAIATVGAGLGGAGISAASNSKRRRRVGGQLVDDVCMESMRIVRESGSLRELLSEEGSDNMAPLDTTVNELIQQCGRLMQEGHVNMNQCAFYVSIAKAMNEEMLESVWLNAYGSVTDQHHGCGTVVNFVNAALEQANSFGIRRTQLENGKDVFTVDESPFRRLLGAAASSVVGAGIALAYMCKSFDENNNFIEA